MPTSEYLDAKIETATLKEVQKVQEAKLARQLDYLFARSLFYKEKFPDCRHSPEGLSRA